MLVVTLATRFKFWSPKKQNLVTQATILVDKMSPAHDNIQLMTFDKVDTVIHQPRRSDID